VEFPGRFEHCLRVRGISGVVASKEGLELTDDLLVGSGKTGGDKAFWLLRPETDKKPFLFDAKVA
jgi:hypothetical protein